jgi:hypothetical protein
MSRTRSVFVLSGLIIATVATRAHAQYPYPYPYAPANVPSLWLWPGSTIEGDIYRGMGVYRMGAGVHEYNHAWAAAI